MKKIIYLLMSCQKYSDRQDNILKTWGKGKEVYFFSEHSDNSRRVIKVCDESMGNYENLPTKFMSLFLEIKKTFYGKYEWYFIGDDDTFVNTRLIEKELNNFDKSKIHGHDYTKYFSSVNYLSGGAGILINRELISKFFEPNLGPFSHGGHVYADVTFGVNMAEKNVDFLHNPLFLPEHPLNYHGIPLDEIYKYYTCHRIIDINEINKLTNVCKKK